MASDVKSTEAPESTAGSMRDSTAWMAVGGVALSVLTLLFLFTNLVLVVPQESFIFLEIGITWAIYAFLVLGLNLQFGYTGLVNFGYLVFFMVGGYGFALLTATSAEYGLGLAWPIGLGGAVIASLLLGLAFGLVALRLRDDFLAIVTLGALLVGQDLIRTFDGFTGGTNGIYGVPQAVHTLAGDYPTSLVTMLLLSLGLLVIVYSVTIRISNAPYGRVLRSIRSDELVSQALGKRTFRYKVSVFVFGAVLAAVAGVLYGMNEGALTPMSFGLHTTIIVWLGMLLGGSGNHRGVLGGLALILGLQIGLEFSAGLIDAMFGSVRIGSIQQIIIGLVLVLIMHYRPEGLWGNADELGVHE